MFNIFAISFFLFLISPLTAASTPLEFTPEEKQFIKTHPQISVANEMDWPPFDYNEYGKPKGFSIDYIKLLSKKIGIEIKFINGYAWQELLELFEEKKIDVLPVMYKNEERKQFTLFSEPYYRGKLGVFARVDNTLESEEDLIKMKVGIEKSHGAIPIIKNRIKDIELTEIKENSELVTQLATERLDAIIGNPLLFYFYIKENQIINIELKHYIKLDGRDQLDTSFHIGVRKDWPLLQSIINKTVASLNAEDIQEIESRWLGFNLKNKPSREKIPLSDRERAYLQSHPVIKVSNELDFPPFDFAVEGMPQGYSIDLINILSEHIGIDIEYVNGFSWSELVKKFKKGEIDLLHTLNKTPLREKFGKYSEPFIYYKTYFFTQKNSPKITEIKQLYGKKVGVGNNWSEHEYLKKNHPEVKLVVFENLEGMLEALSNGEIYAVMNDELSVHYLMKKLNISNITKSGWFKEFDKGESRKFHFMTKRETPELISMFNKALALLSIEDREALERKWFPKTNNTLSKVHLTEEQQSYLAKKEKLLMCVDPNWMPYEQINDKKELIGMSADYVKLFSQRINKDIVLYPTSSWQDSLLSIKSKKCDLIPLIKSTTSRKKYLNFSPSYVTFPFVIATKNDRAFIDNLESIENEKFAVTEGFSIIEDLRQRYQNIKIVEVADAKEGLSKVSSGEVFAYLDASAVIIRTIQKSRITNVKINGNLPWNSELAVGTHIDEPILAQIFHKAVASLTKDEKKQVYDKWIAVKYEKTFDYALLYKIVSVVVLILLISLFWNRKLQKALNALKHMSIELQEKNRELERLSITDKLTQLYNRVHLDKIIGSEISRSKRYNEPFGVIIVDIDHFKLVNDTYGHHTGDIVLTDIANLLTKYSRHNIDVVGR